MKRTGYRYNRQRRPVVSLRASHVAASYPNAVQLSGYGPGIFDQGDTSSCVGHARSRGLFIAAAANEAPLPFIPSPDFLYKIARCYERDYTGQQLTDDGCDPIDTLDAVRLWGITPMVPLPTRFSDVTWNTVNEEPELKVLEEAGDWLLFEDYSLYATGDMRRELFCAAIAAGFPVCLDVPGGSLAWQTYVSGVLSNQPNAPLDHYVVATGYVIDALGRLTVYGHNSWGTEWGIRDSEVASRGAFAADESVLQRASDVIVCVGHRLPGDGALLPTPRGGAYRDDDGTGMSAITYTSVAYAATAA